LVNLLKNAGAFFSQRLALCVRPTWACSNGVKAPCGRITLCYKYSKGITSSL
jgi:7-cyano-7-deazaguanine synthase in queuosine biosynthesis